MRIFLRCARSSSRCAALAALALVAACATQTVYRPATGPGDIGFSHAQLEDRRFRVTFETGADVNAAYAQDLALRRAAELTLEQGHDWFAVTNRYLEADIGGRGPRFSLGLGGADFGGSTSVGGGVGVGFGGGAGQRGYIAQVEFVVGDGPKPEDPDAYDARAIAASLSGRPASAL